MTATLPPGSGSVAIQSKPSLPQRNCSFQINLKINTCRNLHQNRNSKTSTFWTHRVKAWNIHGVCGGGEAGRPPFWEPSMYLRRGAGVVWRCSRTTAPHCFLCAAQIQVWRNSWRRSGHASINVTTTSRTVFKNKCSPFGSRDPHCQGTNTTIRPHWMF